MMVVTFRVYFECHHCGETHDHEFETTVKRRGHKQYYVSGDAIPLGVLEIVDGYYWECHACDFSNTAELIRQPHLHIGEF